jgi:hypothetical protein
MPIVFNNYRQKDKQSYVLNAGTRVLDQECRILVSNYTSCEDISHHINVCKTCSRGEELSNSDELLDDSDRLY